MSQKDSGPCAGCHDNFYNGHNSIGVKECWSLKKAKMVRRFKQPWWEPWPFQSTVGVQTYDCHREPGKYAFRARDPRPSEAELRRERMEVAGG